MQLDTGQARQWLKGFEFGRLFVEGLGWERHSAQLRVCVDGHDFDLRAVAEKRGMTVFVCPPLPDGSIPDHALRGRIETLVGKSAHEHIIIYVDAARTQQVWLWVRREAGRPMARREHSYHTGQSGDPLIQRLRSLAFSLDEEESLTLVDVTGRVRAAFDVERVTKRFYDRFKAQHAAFLKLIEGIADQGDRAWYASVMLNRLMFVYFIQKKGFLDGDPDYLRNRLAAVQERRGRDEFYGFYRHFLLRLFYEGLGQRARTSELDELLGRVPYLDGGLFTPHPVEQRYPGIQIPDAAFEKLFEFFDQYRWHLDERPLRADNEINPDVLGYIFEKYINQKEMGAYYTKEDITEYIAKNTVIPYLLDAARRDCRIAFEGEHSVWRLLAADPDRYIYPAVRKGVELPLPPEIEEGIGDVSRRGGWNRPAPEEYANPTEIWREVVARRQRYEEVWTKLVEGQVRSVDDLITLNLDIRQFAQDVVDNAEGPELLRALWKAIREVTVLDPTVGSGAFLFAALNILEPLYDGCLERMEAFLEDLERSGEKHRPERYGDFRRVLAQVGRHPNRRYFVLKSIVIGNLYGVDIMEEAVEICKLRLFLKLVAQVDRFEGIEPLPDIDFNVRAGNTLVGYVTREEVRQAASRVEVGNGAAQLKMLSGGEQEAIDRIEEMAEMADRAFQQFRLQQTEMGGEVTAADKEELRGRLRALEAELNGYLATEYGVNPKDRRAYRRWLESHRPFHWFVEFYGIMKSGGFDVIIGNPPWKEYAVVRREYTVRGYRTESCGNLYGLCTERAVTLRASRGWISFIVQLPLTSSSRMAPVRRLLRAESSLVSVMPFDDRPGKLFEGLQHSRSVIFSSRGGQREGEHILATGRYQRWGSSVRETLFPTLEYVLPSAGSLYPDQFPKLASRLMESVLHKDCSVGKLPLGSYVASSGTGHFIFYQEATQYWTKATVGLPYYSKNGVVGAPAHGRYLHFNDSQTAHAACAVLNSSLFYTYFIAFGDCFHLSETLALGFRVSDDVMNDRCLSDLGRKLMRDLLANARRTTIRTRDGDEISYDEFSGGDSKPIIDEIDRVLARHYGFTDEELDFIINYDIKYRMGLSGGSCDEDE